MTALVAGVTNVRIEVDGYVIGVRIDQAVAQLDDGTVGAVHYACLTDGERAAIEADIRAQRKPTLDAITSASPAQALRREVVHR